MHVYSLVQLESNRTELHLIRQRHPDDAVGKRNFFVSRYKDSLVKLLAALALPLREVMSRNNKCRTMKQYITYKMYYAVMLFMFVQFFLLIVHILLILSVSLLSAFLYYRCDGLGQPEQCQCERPHVAT